MVEDGSTKLTLIAQLPDRQFPPSVRQAADRLRATVEGLLDRAARAGTIRRDVGVDEVFLLVRGLAQASATAPTTPRTISRALVVVIAGLSA